VKSEKWKRKSEVVAARQEYIGGLENPPSFEGVFRLEMKKPMIGIEPITAGLQNQTPKTLKAWQIRYLRRAEKATLPLA
jgi:hypothetical protein